MIVGCYTLDLYCDGEGCRRWDARQFTGHTEGECKKQARQAGWKFVENSVFCPTCMKAESALKESSR